MTNIKIIKELEASLEWVKKLEPTLFIEFVTYWSIRKSPTFMANELIGEIASQGSSEWIKFIESNHKFRTAYGDEAANELINVIESKRVFSR